LTPIKLKKAVAVHLGSLKQAVVTRYELGNLIYRLYRDKKYRAWPLQLKKDAAQLGDLDRVIRQLVDLGILTPDREFSGKAVFRIFAKESAPAQEIACTVDPFAYVSDLSAMDYHGFTDRLPRSLFLSSPVPVKWNELARGRMQNDCKGFLEDYLHDSFPRLRRMRMSRIGKRPIERRGVGEFHGAYRKVQGRVLRVATIGRTFLNMVQQPARCGGIRHVLEVFEQHAESHLDLLMDELEQHGNFIDRIRAGYILEERCDIRHERIDRWVRHAQRGGSRKLDPQAEYSSRYSDRWSLSINVIGA